MSEQKRPGKLCFTGVRQPSVFEGAARAIDLVNVLGDDDYQYFRNRYGTYVVRLEITQSLLEDSLNKISEDYEKISSDLQNTEAKLEQKCRKRLQSV